MNSRKLKENLHNLNLDQEKKKLQLETLKITRKFKADQKKIKISNNNNFPRMKIILKFNTKMKTQNAAQNFLTYREILKLFRNLFKRKKVYQDS